MGYMVNANCKKCDRNGICHSPKIPTSRFLFWISRPSCKLLLPAVEKIDKEGNVTYDDKCKFQDKYPRPKSPKRQSGVKCPSARNQIRPITGGF